MFADVQPAQFLFLADAQQADRLQDGEQNEHGHKGPDRNGNRTYDLGSPVTVFSDGLRGAAVIGTEDRDSDADEDSDQDTDTDDD